MYTAQDWHMTTAQAINTDTLEAIRTLVKVGISDEAIGRTMRDLLTLTPTPLSAEKRVESTRTPSDSKQDLSSDSTPPESGIQKQTHRLMTKSKLAFDPSEKGCFSFKVRFEDGSVSNVTIAKQVIHAGGQVLGDEEAARKKVRTLAKQAPLTAPNKSKWIQEKLMDEIGMAY